MEINNISTSIDLPNYESSTVELVDANGGTSVFLVDAKQLSTANETIYNNYVNTFAEIAQTRIVKTKEVFTITRITSNVVIDNSIEIDYTTLSNEAKATIDNFYKMILSLNA